MKQPGPTDYNIKSRIGEKQGLTFGVKPAYDPTKYRTITGPADYTPKPIRRIKSGIIYRKPKLETNPSWARLPGPGHYDDSQNKQYYSTLKGSIIGKEPRKSSFVNIRCFTNPGPGMHNNNSFADKQRAPKYGFGSSLREKDYLGLNKNRLH